MTSPWIKSGVLFVKADSTTIGPSEYVPALVAQRYGWSALNVATGEWPDERRLAAAHGLPVFPWMRCRTNTDVDTLVAAAKRWQAGAIVVNLESPDTRGSSLMARTLLGMATVGRALVVTDGWLDLGSNWAGYRHWTGSVECFPEDYRPYEDVAGCVKHAAPFFRTVLPALGAYGTGWKGRLPVRSDYAWPAGKPFVVFPGDTVEDWARWPA